MAFIIPEHLKDKLATAISVINSGPSVRWSFGGGSALECWIRHRHSEDIDLFVPDPQIIPHLSPKMGNITITDEYVEAHNSLKLHMSDYQIDVIASLPLLDDEEALERHEGILVETPSEILHKKVHYRAGSFKPRDFFDFAAILYSGEEIKAETQQLIEEHATTLLERLGQYGRLLNTSEFKDQLQVYPEYQPVLDNVEDIVQSSLSR